MKRMKHYLYLFLNGFLLKPFNLVLSFNIGKDPFADIKRMMKRPTLQCVVDGGAYRGDFSIDISQHFSCDRIYAFEPQKDSFAMLSKNVTNLKEVVPVNCALGQSSGEGTLYTNVSAMTNSLSQNSDKALRYFTGYNDPVGEEPVTVVALAEFMEKEGISAIDLLKLDLQGHELNALLGVRDSLRDVKVIYSEVAFLRLYEGACLFSEIETYLRGQGFIFFQLYDSVRSPDDGRLLYGDAVFLNSLHFDL